MTSPHVELEENQIAGNRKLKSIVVKAKKGFEPSSIDLQSNILLIRFFSRSPGYYFRDVKKKWDLNPRYLYKNTLVFKTNAINHSTTHPKNF